jgi:hypothetical protein
MKIAKFANTTAGQVTIIAVVGIGVLYLAERKARKVASDVSQAINPANNDNIFAAGVDSIGAKLTGNDNFKLGVWIYDKIHG